MRRARCNSDRYRIDTCMLEVARGKPMPTVGRVEFVELSAAEIEDYFARDSLDAVIACLATSELSVQEQDYVLRAAYSCLAPGGAIVIADETIPESRL